MRILVTGGCGFIGSHIVDELIDLNYEVLVIDNLITGSLNNLNPKAKFVQMDVLDENMSQIFIQFKPEVVIHHAAQIDVQHSLKNPKFDATSNILGAISVLECCRDAGVRKIVYASSAAIYGNPNYYPIDEEHAKEPLSFYGISKLTPEHYIKVFSELYNIKYTILRYSNAYGYRQDPKGEGGVISIFMNRILNGENPHIFGDGEQVRDFIYVKDIANANLSVLEKGDNEIFNVSSSIPITINKLYEIMSNATETSLAPIYKEQRNGDIRKSYLDNSKIALHLNWEPKYSLERGLKETLAMQKELDFNLKG
ncbi:NAD-dependent epimerase/dehydratase family protein [Paenibacillus sp. FSL H8-0537]|uniref:NAD-dependent epimerase/dehydratase family protein n=1 Tax=Paenibacillus sp. FSL H8-0537 TaxID=2921399 RepID=UPI003101602B